MCSDAVRISNVPSGSTLYTLLVLRVCHEVLRVGGDDLDGSRTGDITGLDPFDAGVTTGSGGGGTVIFAGGVVFLGVALWRGTGLDMSNLSNLRTGTGILEIGVIFVVDRGDNGVTLARSAKTRDGVEGALLIDPIDL